MADRIGAVGGTLAVTSEPGEGTTLEFRIRVSAGNPAPSDAIHA
jgi:signal transduction histidine kinase